MGLSEGPGHLLGAALKSSPVWGQGGLRRRGGEPPRTRRGDGPHKLGALFCVRIANIFQNKKFKNKIRERFL